MMMKIIMLRQSIHQRTNAHSLLRTFLQHTLPLNPSLYWCHWSFSSQQQLRLEMCFWQRGVASWQPQLVLHATRFKRCFRLLSDTDVVTLMHEIVKQNTEIRIHKQQKAKKSMEYLENTRNSYWRSILDNWCCILAKFMWAVYTEKYVQIVFQIFRI